MKHTALDAEQLKEMLMAGAASLAQHKEEINSLNVFPVPDGDTGTNMNLTMESANQAILKASDSIDEVAEALTKGSLMGARGNSGVILSQIFRGIAASFATVDIINPTVFATALQSGAETAYKAVIKPVEGTILTVAKSAANSGLVNSREQTLNDFLEKVLADAQQALEQTPEQLPVLKEAGVVDAGGKGLVYIIQGWLNYLHGVKIKGTYAPTQVTQPTMEPQPTDMKYQYCTEFIITGDNVSEDLFRTQLAQQGDSLVVVGAGNIVKVHVHTDNPGTVLDFALSQGDELQDIKIDNMKYQHRETNIEPETKPQRQQQNGVIAVSSGDGLGEIFASMGVDHVIFGGQTMNPSTEDFLSAMDKINAKQIILLPNNSNILLAAKQAAEVAPCPTVVIPTKTIPQGLAAMLNYDAEEQDLSALEKAMESGLADVKTGQVTFAVRDSVFDNKPIAEGNILGIADGTISVVEEDVSVATVRLVQAMVDEDSEIITFFYGEDVSKEQAEEIATAIEEEFPDCEIELHRGGQSLYYFIIAIE